MASTAPNADRLDLRLPPDLKERWERAAELAGVSSLASFVKMAVTERADELIREHDMLVLSPQESIWLREFLNEPARETTAALKGAAERHAELVESP